MIRFVVLLALVALASCGVDGAPIIPNVHAGSNFNLSGVKTSVNLDTNKGPMAVNWSMI
jgi:hypothetical protein